MATGHGRVTDDRKGREEGEGAKRPPKNMLVRTHKAQESRYPSTDMHSGAGISTINVYNAFKNLDRPVPRSEKDREEIRQKRLLEALTFVPETVGAEMKRAGIGADLPKLLRDAVGRQKDGLRRRDSGEGDGEDSRPLSHTETIPEEDEGAPISARSKELPGWSPNGARPKIKAVPGQQQAFNVRPRDDPLILKRFYGVPLSQGPSGIPKYSFVHREYKSNVRLQDPSRRTKPRPSDPRTPKGMAGSEEPRTFSTRKAVRQGLATREGQRGVLSPLGSVTVTTPASGGRSQMAVLPTMRQDMEKEAAPFSKQLPRKPLAIAAPNVTSPAFAGTTSVLSPTQAAASVKSGRSKLTVTFEK